MKELTDGRYSPEGEVLDPEYAGIPRAAIPEDLICQMVNRSYEENMRRLIEGDWVRQERNVTSDAQPAHDLSAPAPQPPEPPANTESGTR